MLHFKLITFQPYKNHLVSHGFKIRLKDDQKVGFIALEHLDTHLNIAAIEVYKDQRKEGIAGSALRQLPTYVRKHFKEIRSIGITLFGENNELKPLCISSGFVETDQSDDLVIFKKYINY